ncbi:unnamed protein product [Nezara viridula]|uniref:BZIP domain-containing protein n=1 Tax=Nezara viridula TaxID=85310 RepID=A0A9P0HM96_NEZVI|nr:unnamed protein product [Nezara viridula]
MDTWNTESSSFQQEYGPFYEPDQGPVYHQLEPPMIYPMTPGPNSQEARIHRLSKEEAVRSKLEKRRERNRQASARYRERKEQLLAYLEAETRKMAQEVADLEARLQRGMKELAQLKAEANGGYEVVTHNGNQYIGL